MSGAPIAPRSHKKSRAGCTNCKRRKVKCDERHPLCRNCERHYQNLEKCFDDGPQTEVSVIPSRSYSQPQSSLSGSEHVSGARTTPISTEGLVRATPLPGTLSGGLVDPFQTYPATKAPKADIYLRHYLSTLVYRSFPFFHTGQSVIQLWWPFLRADTVLFHVILHLSAYHLERLEQENNARRSDEVKEEALDLLRQKIASDSPISDQLIVAVATLMAIEHDRSNMRALQTHLVGLRRMLVSRGGLDNLLLTNPMAANIAFWNALVSTNQTQKLAVAFSNPVVFETGPSNFDAQVLSDRYQIPEQYISILFEVNELSSLFSTIPSSSSPDEGLSILGYLCSVLQRVFQMQAEFDLENPSIFHLSECCRYASALHILFPLMAFFPDPVLLVSDLVHNLKSSVYSLITSMYPQNEMVLWFLAVGAVSAYQMPERQWFEGHLAVVASDLNLISWDEMRSALVGVISHAIFCEDSFSTMWHEAQAAAT